MKPTVYKQRESRANPNRARRAATQGIKPESMAPTWTGPDLPRIAPGRYTASAVRIIPPVYLGRWRRYSMGICFAPLDEPGVELVLFRNLGGTNAVKRGSDYFRDWTRANGGPPARGQKMDPDVFLDGQIYEIEVVDAAMDSEGSRKSDAEIYSKVQRLVDVRRTDGTVRGVISAERT